jgi:hypothetical protein
MSFALRGAPCGDDPGPWAAFGSYHNEQVPLLRLSDQDETSVVPPVPSVRPCPMQRIVFDGTGILERHTVPGQVHTSLLREGRLPSRALGLTIEWAAQHRDELFADWELASTRQPLRRIEPLR